MIEFLDAAHLALIPAMWIYSGIFVICLLEGAPVVGSFFPGGTTLFAVGAVAGVGVVDPIWIVVLAGLGSILGDLIGFFVLKLYGHRVKFLKKMIDGVRNDEGWLSDIFDKKYFIITILARLIPFVRAASSIAAAVRLISLRGYVVATVLASTLWAAAGTATGYGLTGFMDVKYIIMSLIVFCFGSALLAALSHVRRYYTSSAVV